ncbi:MAG: hypothetical protein V7634_1524 [Bradyrhizobium sp.]|jgi:hypothetical protein
MHTQSSLFGHGIAMNSLVAEPNDTFQARDRARSARAGWSEPRTDLVFAAKLLRCLRGGSMPPPNALEWSGYVEHWTVIARDDLCLLTGIVWRLPLRRHTLETPLIAIDPAAGWARAIGEWFTIGVPCIDPVAAGIHPEGVADRAARWLERQLGPNDEVALPL